MVGALHASSHVFLRHAVAGSGSKVCTRIVPAVFGESMFDAVRLAPNANVTANHHAECNMVYMTEEKATTPYVVTGPQCDDAPRTTAEGRGHVLPFGRATDHAAMLSYKCPTVGLKESKWYDSHSRHHPFVKLGVAAAIIDHKGRVLLTRRAKHMRSFPSAWVLPGGGLDEDEDKSLADVVVREVQEEIGVKLDGESIVPVGLWESCYPTNTADCIKDGNGIRAHYVVVFCIARTVDKEPRVTLQQEETDLAVWMTPQQFKLILANPLSGQNLGTVQAAATVHTNGFKTPNLVPLVELAGIYPRGDAQCGIAQGHLFILEKLLENDAGRFVSPPSLF